VIEAVPVSEVILDGDDLPAWVMKAQQDNVLQVGPTQVWINTAEGEMRGESGDWLIRGVAGELYPCNSDIFEATYEPAGGSDRER